MIKSRDLIWEAGLIFLFGPNLNAHLIVHIFYVKSGGELCI